MLRTLVPLLAPLLPLAAEPAPVVAPAPLAGGAKVYLTVEEALELAFPECEIDRRTVYLTDEQRERAEDLAGVDVDDGIVFPYVATRDGELVGTAWFDAHRVRTLRETVLFVVAPDRSIDRIELCAFAEPEEYVPRAAWYAQFVGRKLDDDLNLKRGIRGVTGATLTATATTRAARRTLALHAVVFPPPPPTPEPEPEPKVGAAPAALG